MKVIRSLFQFLFRKPLLWIIHQLSSAPKQKDVYKKLTSLYQQLLNHNQQIGLTKTFHLNSDKYVIMSDLHKGNGNNADDFVKNAFTYKAACYYYLQQEFNYIALGDIEELWKNNIASVIAQNEDSIQIEKLFIEKNRFHKVVGNHDLFWRNSPFFSSNWLKKMYGKVIPVHEAFLLQTTINNKKIDILLTHGHQGDKTSDGNKFSKWFVANIWSRVQSFLDINPNFPSKDYLLRDKHNRMMYEWSEKQQNLILITGHTHKPVFASTSHIDKLKKLLEEAIHKNDLETSTFLENEITIRMREYITAEPYQLKKPSYFNTGCCCYEDGDMTVIEIENNEISLVKWTQVANDVNRIVLQKMDLSNLSKDL